jgi:hypothetical protein
MLRQGMGSSHVKTCAYSDLGLTVAMWLRQPHSRSRLVSWMVCAVATHRFVAQWPLLALISLIVK